MKKCIYLLSVIFLYSIAVTAQTQPVNKTDWILFAPTSEEFSAETPGNLLPYRYSGVFEGTYFFIFSDNSKGDFQYEIAQKFVKENQPAELEKQKSSEVLSFKFSDDENFFHTINMVKTKKRAYIFHLVSDKEYNPSVQRFFKSLKINEKPASVVFEDQIADAKSKNEIQQSSENKNSEQSKTTSETGADKGSGEGSGIGNGSGVAAVNKSNSQNSGNIDSDSKLLKLTSLPKPKYTDFARSYEIVGTVRVRITFRNDGTISSAIPVTKLPFGLTKSAIEAAKQIRFEPQIQNGVKVSVTKVVIFNFTIY